MKKIKEILKNIFDWIWILILLCIVVYFIGTPVQNEYYINFIGAGIILLLVLRRILIFFNKVKKGNPYFYLVIFIIAITFPLLFELFAKKGLESTEFMQFVIFYPIGLFLFIGFLGKRGKFGKKMQASIKKSEDNAKQKSAERETERKKSADESKIKRESELQQKVQSKEKTIVYCEFCGKDYPTTKQLISSSCSLHPNGAGKGKHKKYEGTKKDRYDCKYCGNVFDSILKLTRSNCSKHPSGAGKGRHSPSL